MRRALVLSLLAVASVATGAGAADAELRLSEEFRMEEATLVLGHLDPGDEEISDVHAVDVHRLDVPQGTLYVCPFEGGRSGEVPPIPTLQQRCRGEESYENPSLSVGARTWLAFAGNLTLQQPPNASTTMLVPDPDNGTLRLAGVTAGDMHVGVDDALAFRPQLPASQVRVEEYGETRTYNGTEWIFYLEASGTARLEASGIQIQVPTPANLTLRPAGTAAMREALEPRTLLDLQSATLGPESRQPVANASRLAGDTTRFPPLVDGAILGHLNGTIGERSFTPEETALVSLSRFDANVSGVNLTGTASARFVKTEAGVAPGLSTPSGVPWIPAVVVWILAGVTIAVGPPPPVRSLRDRSLGVAAFGLALLVWDLLFASAFGTSALSAAGGEAGAGVMLALGAFETIAFGLAWLLLALPARIVGERWLVDRLAGAVSLLATAVLLAYAALDPGAIVAVGRLLALF